MLETLHLSAAVLVYRESFSALPEKSLGIHIVSAVSFYFHHIIPIKHRSITFLGQLLLE